MKPFKKVIVTVKSHLSSKDDVTAGVLRILDNAGVSIAVDGKRSSDLPCSKGYEKAKSFADADAIVVIGGDGTIFRTLKEMPDLSIPILGINQGAVGFLAEVDLDEAATIIPKLLAGKGVIEERALLSVSATRGKKTVFEAKALNEAVISQGAIARLLRLKTSVNGEPLTTFRADGIIVATPTGSTAYSLSAGGPILHPKLQSMLLTPLNAHSFGQKPIVLPSSSTVEIDVVPPGHKGTSTNVSLTVDGQNYVALEPGDRVTFSLHGEKLRFIRRKEDTFFHTLRTKLKWGEDPSQRDA